MKLLPASTADVNYWVDIGQLSSLISGGCGASGLASRPSTRATPIVAPWQLVLALAWVAPH
jgi:hypothetical protein